MGHSPWLVVRGYGSHIRSTRSDLIIQRGGKLERHPLGSVRHLLIVGGHNLHTAAVTALLRAGGSISFFDADGMPAGMLHPYGERPGEEIRTAQESTPQRKYAVGIATTTIRIRTMLVERMAEVEYPGLLYEGESILLHQYMQELENLVRMEEIRRLYKLASDMYYEIFARTVPPELGFRRRTERPHRDPVNAMLSLGYAVLFGACAVTVTGAHLDPDLGALHEGPAGLVHDIAEPLKPRMVDEVVFPIVQKGLDPSLYECTEKRCHLDDELTGTLIEALHQSIQQDKIDQYVCSYLDSLLNNTPFQVMY